MTEDSGKKTDKPDFNLFENILNSLDAHIIVSDLKTDEVFLVNDKTCGLYNLRENPIGKKCWEVLHPERSERCAECPKDEMRASGKSVIEWERYHKELKRYYRSTDRIIKWKDKDALLQLFIDITDIKHTEELLNKRLEQRALIASISHNLLTNDDTSSKINSALERSGEFTGATAVFLCKYDDAAERLNIESLWKPAAANDGLTLQDGLSFPKTTQFYKIFRAKNYFALTPADMKNSGACIQLADTSASVSCAPLSMNGEAFGVLVYCFKEACRDEIRCNELSVFILTLSNMLSGLFVKNEMENKLRKLKEVAENANKAKTEFLSRMSHEIRTPMNAIVGMTSIARKAKELEKKDYCLEKIDGASKQLLELINNILDMSKIEADKMELVSEDFNLEKSIRKITETLGYAAEEKKQALIINLNKNVPLNLKGDELRITQIITNLLSNACKFTPEQGTIILSVDKISEEADNITLNITVTDNGIGIAKEHQDKLFNSFEQADGSISRKFGGTGLGLSIVKRLTELMGGGIKIESETGKGSKFICTVNLKKGSQTESSAENKDFTREKLSVNLKSFKNLNILLADDVDVNREIIIAMLEDTGIKIDTAATGVEAVCKYKENPSKYGLILMDLYMPEMDGYQATAEIRALENGRNVPIVAMTASVFKEDIEKCMKAGMNDHIAKPVDSVDLYLKISKYMKAPVVKTEKPIEPEQNGDVSAYLPFIDVKTALTRVMNNKTLYFTLLKNFYDKKMTDILCDNIKKGDTDGIIQTAHALRGVAANLGLNELFSIVQEIEMLAKNNMRVKEYLKQLESVSAKTTEAIKKLLNGVHNL